MNRGSRLSSGKNKTKKGRLHPESTFTKLLANLLKRFSTTNDFQDFLSNRGLSLSVCPLDDSTVLMACALIASVYVMNFNELQEHGLKFGYFCLGLNVFTILGILCLFMRKPGCKMGAT